ncbi:MAG: hypothetical protein E4H17_01580 [Gemmatimonadales bacterium]|nr:MAG: hypothetical protein E4H17_01580 [Gemmatimonadales bacterium]
MALLIRQGTKRRTTNSIVSKPGRAPQNAPAVSYLSTPARRAACPPRDAWPVCPSSPVVPARAARYACGMANYRLLGDRELLAQCDVHIYKSSGPGGQHRNKVSSAVRLRHRPTGITAHGDDTRSQHDNRRLALRRLRMNLALKVRQGVDLAHPVRPPGWDDFLARGATGSRRSQDGAPGQGGPPSQGSLPSRGSPGRLVISPENERFWIMAAHVLDVLEACQGHLANAAGVLGVTGSNLTRVLQSHRHLLAAAQNIRKAFGQRPIS